LVLDAAGRGESRAVLAIDVYVHRLRRLIGAMAASLDRVDALVFTGGVGEHAASIREQVCASLGVLGVRGGLLTSPDGGGGDGIVSTAGVPVLVVHAREDLQIAHEVRRLIAGS